MTLVLQPVHLLAVIFAGWAHRHQQRVIDYLLEENRTFKQQMRRRKLRLTDVQRARLAVLSLRTFCTLAREFSPPPMYRAEPGEEVRVTHRGR